MLNLGCGPTIIYVLGSLYFIFVLCYFKYSTRHCAYCASLVQHSKECNKWCLYYYKWLTFRINNVTSKEHIDMCMEIRKLTLRTVTTSNEDYFVYRLHCSLQTSNGSENGSDILTRFSDWNYYILYNPQTYNSLKEMQWRRKRRIMYVIGSAHHALLIRHYRESCFRTLSVTISLPCTRALTCPSFAVMWE